MAELCDSVSINMETIPFNGQEFTVETSNGQVSVSVIGDPEMPALITYPDIALDYASCFGGLISCHGSDSFLLQNFCIYHINPPWVEKAFCMGALAGAYILTLFAIKHGERSAGLILVSPLCRAPSWTEWIYNKMLLSLLNFYGVCGLFKELLLFRFFSEDVRWGADGPKSEALDACQRLLDDRERSKAMRYLIAINRRRGIAEELKELRCRALIVVGSVSPFYSEAIHLSEKMDCINADLVEIDGCGSLVTEEQPAEMLPAVERFLASLGHARRSPPPRPKAPPAHIPPELLSPEALGLKLKPIKTRSSSVEAA
ncbi:protein NDL1-like isoform X2 [Wolffia australiana]